VDAVTPNWSLRVDYELATPVKPYSVLAVATEDGPDTASNAYLHTRTFVDGLGRTRMKTAEADKMAGLDAGDNVRSEISIFDAKGAVAAQHIAHFTDQAIGAAPDTEAIPVSFATIQYDAFGREITKTDLGGVTTLETRYHALSKELWDAADREDTEPSQPGVQRGKHYGTFAGVRADGHGRAIATSERVNYSAPATPVFETRETRTQYLPTGEPEVITRLVVGNGSVSPVVRWMRYDSLGRMVLNVEPHTSVNYVPPGGDITNLKAWRYAYNDAGDLVGTSDARGCGVNYYYDCVSRLMAEDYSPCEAHHVNRLPLYSAPNFVTFANIEVSYQYDLVPASFTARLPAPPGYVPNAPNLKGKLAAVFDRSGITYMTYDARGRLVRMDKAIANPDPMVISTTTRYQLPWFTKHIAYDSMDRVVEETTGASAPELLGSNSWIENTYSGRGALSQVSSSYGELVAGIRRSADGLVEQIKHGDAADTSTVHIYDERRFLVESSVERAIPPLWSSPPANYQPAPEPSTTQMTLRFDHIDYDVVGNPIAIADLRDKADWPAGAKPVTRQIEYDNLYRATRVDYVYEDGSDGWVSPHAAELSGLSDPRRPSDVPAHLVLPERVKRQTYIYDWLGSLTKSEDDRNAFWDRGMGPMRTHETAGMPYRFRDAGDRAVASWPGEGWADATYDETGNVTRVRVSRGGACTNGTTDCSHFYYYEYDELGRTYHARRYEGTPPKAELRFVYDHSDNRVIKSDILPSGTADDRHTLYVFNTLELRRAPHDATNLRYVANGDTEVPYLVANGVRLGRVVLEGPSDGEPRLESTNARHLFLNLGDHLGSASIVLDHATGELVERMTYQPYGATESDYRPSRWKGFREDYRFTGKEEDVEVGLTYFGKRFLSAPLGRWLSPDPLAVHSPGAADLNLYAYVKGAVLKATDPLGLADCPAGNQCDSGGQGTSGNPPGGASEEPLGERTVPALDGSPSTGARGTGSMTPGSIVLDEVVIGADIDAVTADKGHGGGPANPIAINHSIDNGVHGQGQNGPEKASDLLAQAKGGELAADVMLSIVAPELAVGSLRSGLWLLGAKGGAAAREVAGAGSSVLKAPFNPTGSMTNCVNGVCAFLNSVRTGTFRTAGADVAENLGSIRTVLTQVEGQTGAQIARAGQWNVLQTGHNRQFFVVFRGSSAAASDHVAVGIVNNGRSLIYDPQTGQRFWNLADFGSFTAYPVKF
jgi:RHS repeat-associated protein